MTTRPAPMTGQYVKDLWESTELHAPTLADWKPSSTSRRLHKRDFRWTMVLGTVLLLATAAVFAYWLYQRPVQQATAAKAAVFADANKLNDALEGVGEVVSLLAVPVVDHIDYTPTLLASDDAARDLFTSSAELTPTSDPNRLAAADAAGIGLNVSRVAGNAMAYRLALEPVLTLPAFETDPGLTDLATATQEFAAWWARFDRIVTALPQGVTPEVTNRLTVLRIMLDSWQTAYVDALRLVDGPSAATILADLQAELDEIRAELLVSLEALAAEVSEQLDQASQRLDLLVG